MTAAGSDVTFWCLPALCTVTLLSPPAEHLQRLASVIK